MRIPKYRKHSGGQARVTIKGRDFLLGPYGSPESHEAYKAKVAELIAADSVELVVLRPNSLSMAELCEAYLEFAEKYYRGGSEYRQLVLAIKPISELYSFHLAVDFGPTQYKAVRDWWLKREVPQSDDADGNEREPRRCSRQYINRQMKRLLRVLKWASGEGLVPVSVHQTLQCISPLKKGRNDAPEAPPVLPVDASLVLATLKHLPKVVQDMIKLQCATGCRPGEVCALTPSMVDRSEDVWVIRPPEHKTAWRGKDRAIYCNDYAKSILAPYLLRGPSDPCFSPREAQEQRFEARTRSTPLNQGNRAGYTKKTRSKQAYKRQPGTEYTTQSYGRAIGYVCKRMKLTKWAPNQIRHSVATEVNAMADLEAASLLLGHSGVDITKVYAERNKAKAVATAKQYKGFATG